MNQELSKMNKIQIKILRLEMSAHLIVHISLGIFRLIHYVSSCDIILLYNLLQVLQAIIAIRIIFHSFLNYLEMNTSKK